MVINNIEHVATYLRKLKDRRGWYYLEMFNERYNCFGKKYFYSDSPFNNALGAMTYREGIVLNIFE